MYVPHTNVLLLWAVVISLITLQKNVVSTQATEITTNQHGLLSEISRTAKFFFEKCLFSGAQDNNKQLHHKDNAAAIFEDCLKRKGLQALDRALSRDVIEISDNVVIVKWLNYTRGDDENDNNAQKTSKSLKVTTHWDQHQFIEKVSHFLKTRVLKISFKGFKNGSRIQSEARGRDKNNNSFGQMLVFGLVAAGFIVIPLGFQFLAVLGGKALLLAKLALLLSSIQGLKKIATSDVNYGLYSTGHAGPWHFDRKWPSYEADHYPSSYYTSAIGSPISEHYGPSSGDHHLPLTPMYNSLHPRGETSYS